MLWCQKHYNEYKRYLNFFKCLFISEKECMWTGEGQRQRGTEDPKQPLCWQQRARCGAWTHEPWAHGLSWSHLLNWLSHPDTPKIFLNFYRGNSCGLWRNTGPKTFQKKLKESINRMSRSSKSYICQLHHRKIQGEKSSDQYIKENYYFFKVYLFIYFGGEEQRQRISSRFFTASGEPDAGLELKRYELSPNQKSET